MQTSPSANPRPLAIANSAYWPPSQNSINRHSTSTIMLFPFLVTFTQANTGYLLLNYPLYFDLISNHSENPSRILADQDPDARICTNWTSITPVS